MPLRNPRSILGPFLFASVLFCAGVSAQPCDPEPTLFNHQGGGSTVCPCFIPGEEAGAVFVVPSEDVPIQILHIGIGWGSLFGGNPQQIEQAIHVYGAGLPNPGGRLHTLPGPQLTDGFINDFNVEALGWTVATQPVTVTLEFLNQSSGNFSASSLVHDGNGCTPGRNVVKTLNPDTWNDACALGVTGDWVFYLIYRKTDCPTTGIGDTGFALSAPAFLLPPSPNPFRSRTQVTFLLDEPGFAEVSVYDVAGRHLATLAEGAFPEGETRVAWDGAGADGARVPAGVYFVRLAAGGAVSTRKVFVES